ncbi:hypothetical protein [Sphingobacterium litopenaei]|uniref:Outer membrane protein beta-barrel domain-containing protein n=1 Tax=Sphingobacterium litopenaei TaxID=2763500 RepID=A0ABR7YAQ7_9SPHI|nr:hypothetical protein [Sphingobacterium litopenaei]MBD1428388.1 hypothetical protein [Sphingobacterium litopenaei]
MNNKDLIEDIKAKLKASQELPYREGAWERFAAQQGNVTNASGVKVLPFRRLASIAAAGIMVLGVSLYLYQTQNTSSNPSIETQIASSNSLDVNSDPREDVQNQNEFEIRLAEASAHLDNNLLTSIPNSNNSTEAKLTHISTIEGINESDLLANDVNENSIAQLKTITTEVLPYKPFIEQTPSTTIVNPSVSAMAHQTANLGFNSDGDNLKPSSKMSLGDKFQLGLYVSPHRTSDKFDVGAGFLVSYALTNKISLRTGTSYNSYSVGVMKDPMEMSNAEMINMESAPNNSLITENAYASKQQMILPNVNAVMGKVEALEIPLDITYTFNKGFYSSAGVSYSAIINQQREAQYIENAGIISLQDKASLIPGAAQSLNKAEVKTVKSVQDNVNPNGFNGFANFSIGKKVNINNKMSLSLEPFVKVPLGQFRKSDLDYTNSGIKIITTF